MRINSVWVGWGLGDNSATDFTVRKIKDYMRKMYSSYAGQLADTNLFDQQMYDAVSTMQRRYVAQGKLRDGTYIEGVLDLETQYVMGFKKRPVNSTGSTLLPVIFTVEGHLSNMWAGPCATNAQTLQAEGKVYWQPVGYDCGALPFNNPSADNELVRLLSSTKFDNGVAFPAGCPWGIIGFSQGAQVVSDFIENHVIPENGNLHWRFKDFKRGLALGNPRRGMNSECSWAERPTKPNTQGIMDNPFDAVKLGVGDRWAEHANAGDMFAENTTDSVGQYKTAIAKIVTTNSWVGGPAALVSKILGLLVNPFDSINIAIAAIEALIFLASNPNPHYSTVARKGDIDWMRGVAV